MSKRNKQKQNQPIVNIQQLVDDPNFQLMNDFLSLAGRLVRHKPEFVKMTDEQRNMIDKLGQTADIVKEKQEEIIRQN